MLGPTDLSRASESPINLRTGTVLLELFLVPGTFSKRVPWLGAVAGFQAQRPL